MTISRLWALPLAAMGAGLAMPAMAQSDDTPVADGSYSDNDGNYRGFYIGGGVGATMQPSRPGSAIVFDRANNGQFGTALPTAAGANAFSPGFCSGYFTSSAAGNCVDDRNRPDYSVKIGFDSRSGNIVAGLLVEGEINKSRDATSAFSTTPAAYRISRGLDYGFAVRGRVGYTPNGAGLFYLTGGLGYAKSKHIFQTTNTANQFTPMRDRSWILGGQAGGGAEAMVTKHVGLGIEYLYNRYRDNKYYVAVTQGSAPATNPFLLAGGRTNLKVLDPYFTFHTVRATMSYHF